MSTVVFKNGLLINGTGSPPVPADLLISGATIQEIGTFEVPVDGKIVDCRGLAVAPGFIDSHSHSDLQVLDNRPEKVAQGVTTEVVGNCGFSPYPAPPDRKVLQEYANGLFCSETDWGWESAKTYLQQAGVSNTATVFSLVGHGSLRVARVGHKLGQLEERDLDWMEQKLSESLEEGACGFSTGLMYSPGASAPSAELERLCHVVARHGKTYATHMRDYGDHVVQAVDEQLELVRRTGCRLQISHLQAVGQRNWDKQARALEKIEGAVAEGLDVGFDCYPYIAGSTVLTQLLPQWALEGGIEGLLARLADRDERKRIAVETETNLAQGWTNILISALETPANRNLIGQSIAAIAISRGCPPVDVVMDLIQEEQGRVNMLEMNQSEENLRQTLSHPLSCIISDGFYVKGRPHPRLYGTFPLFLGEMSRKRGWLTLAEAVHKVTEKPALRFSIPKRGCLQRGYFADVVVFDPRVVDGPASYQDPTLAPRGICHVFRNGAAVLSNGVVQPSAA